MNIQVKIEPVNKAKRDRLYLGDAVAHCQQLVDLLRTLDSAHGEGIAFELVSMSKNSPLEMAVTPMNPHAKFPRALPTVSKRISAKLAYVLDGHLPDDLTDDDVTVVSKIVATARKLGREQRQMLVWIGDKEFLIGKRVADRLEKLLNYTTIEYGAMTGTLEVVKNRDTQTFILYPTVGPKSITCHFEAELMETVIDSLKHRQMVEVEGKMVQRRKSRYPHVIYVQKIDRVDEDNGVSLLSFRGSLKGKKAPNDGWLSDW